MNRLLASRLATVAVAAPPSRQPRGRHTALKKKPTFASLPQQTLRQLVQDLPKPPTRTRQICYDARANASTANSLQDKLNVLINQSLQFCTESSLLSEILGINTLKASDNVGEFFRQILSRDMGTSIKMCSDLLAENTKTDIVHTIFADIDAAVREDPVNPTPFQVASMFIGAKALMTHRYAHALWNAGEKDKALALAQSAHSNYHVYIHPSADIAPGVVIDHGFNVKIEEGAKIAAGTYILHGAHIGKNTQIGANTLIGANAHIADDLTAGEQARIAAGCTVTANVPAHTTVFGWYNEAGSHKIVPARLNAIDTAPQVNQEEAKTELRNTLNTLKNRIPYNPNSPLMLERLERFFNKCQDTVDKEYSTPGQLALSAVRIAQAAWQESNSPRYTDQQKTELRNFALWLQGRNASLFRVDVHPAAVFGDNVTFPDKIEKGIVVGATATVGDNVSFGDGVTLGASGTEEGDRHPKIGNNVTIGNNAVILGRGKVKDRTHILSGAVLAVVGDSIIAEDTTWAGKPAVDVTEKIKASLAAAAKADAAKAT